jgi:hypothetical protein
MERLLRREGSLDIYEGDGFMRLAMTGGEGRLSLLPVFKGLSLKAPNVLLSRHCEAQSTNEILMTIVICAVAISKLKGISVFFYVARTIVVLIGRLLRREGLGCKRRRLINASRNDDRRAAFSFLLIILKES